MNLRHKLRRAATDYRVAAGDLLDLRECAPCIRKLRAAMESQAKEQTKPSPPVDMILRTESWMAPGDVLMLTAAVRDLHRSYPGRFRTGVIVDGPGEGHNHVLFDHNPYITPLGDLSADAETLDVGYGRAIQRSNQERRHFLNGFIDDVNFKLGLSISLTEFRPDVYLSDDEKKARPVDGPYWLIFSGGRGQFETKLWSPRRWQAVVGMLRGEVDIIQAGAAGDTHPSLAGALDLRGRTNLRRLMALVYHAEGVLCSVSLPMHLAAAFNKPCVVVAYGGEPVHWEAYTEAERRRNVPGDDAGFRPHRYLHAVGTLECCANGKGCWKSKVLGGKPDERCRHLRNEHGEIFPECVAAITPERVAEAVRAEAGRPRIEASTSMLSNSADTPTLHVFSNMGVLGGGEHSTITLMHALRARGVRIEFWPLTEINDQWREGLFRAADVVHRDWHIPELPPGAHVLFYMNDYGPKLRRWAAMWREALLPAAGVQLVLNYTTAELHKEGWLLKKLTGVYFLNDAKRRDWEKAVRTGAVAPTHVLAPPVDLEPFIGIPQTARVPGSPLIIGRLGGSAAKLPAEIIALIRDAHRLTPEARFWFMPGNDTVREYAQKNEYVRVFERDEIPVAEFLQRCHMVWHPVADSVSDQGPRVVVEAMAAARAVIAEKRGGAPDRIEHEKTGILVTHRVDMADWIAEFANDDGRRLALGRGARAAAQRDGPERWGELIEEAMHHVATPQAAPASAKTAKPSAARPRFLVHIRGGQGLGNVINMVPAMKLLATAGDVDLLIVPGYDDLFRRSLWLRTVASKADQLPRALAKYDAIVPTPYLGGPPGHDLPNIAPPFRGDRWAVPEAEAAMQRVRALGIDGPTRDTSIFPILSHMPNLPESYVALGACCRSGEHWLRKRWPHFEALAQLLKTRKIQSVFVGNEHDHRLREGDCGVDLCGKTSVLELATVLDGAALFIGNDCGPGHLAAALGTPTLTLFGPTANGKNRPFSSRACVLRSEHPCQACQSDSARWKACENAECLLRLQPGAVADMALEMLRGHESLDVADVVKRTNRRITREDAEALRRWCDGIEAKTALEIGAADGGSTVILAESVRRRNGRLYSIEARPTGRWRENLQHWNLDSFVTLIEGRSPDAGREVVPREIDFLFIDGDHSTAAALADYAAWAPRVRKGGMVVFHDYGADQGRTAHAKSVALAVHEICKRGELCEVEAVKTPQGSVFFRKG